MTISYRRWVIHYEGGEIAGWNIILKFKNEINLTKTMTTSTRSTWIIHDDDEDLDRSVSVIMKSWPNVQIYIESNYSTALKEPSFQK